MRIEMITLINLAFIRKPTRSRGGQSTIPTLEGLNDDALYINVGRSRACDSPLGPIR